MSQFLAASPLIIAVLQAALSTLQGCKIRPAIDLDYVVQNALSNSVSVIFFDDVPDIPAGDGFNTLNLCSEQYWLIVISARNVTDVGNASLADTGTLADAVLTALQGVLLSERHGELRRVKSPYRQTTIDGYTHLPLMFTTKIYY